MHLEDFARGAKTHSGRRASRRQRSGIKSSRVASFTLLLISALFNLGGCSRHAEPERRATDAGSAYETLELRYQGASGSVLFPELAADLGYLEPIKLRWIGNTTSGPQDIQSVVTNDVEFGAAFNGSVIKLVLAGAPIRAVLGMASVDRDTWSGFYVLDGSKVRSARDFIGKKVGMNTVGAHSEFVLREYLYRGGLTKAEVAEVTLVSIPPVNSEQSLRQGQLDVATLGGILRDKALERGGIHAVFSDYDLFGAFTSASYVLRRQFIEKNPKSARKFVSATARALEWSRETPREKVIERLERIIAERKRNEDASALKYWRATRADTKGGVVADRDFGLWIDWLVRDGQLAPAKAKPGEFFTNQFNPYVEVSVARAGASLADKL